MLRLRRLLSVMVSASACVLWLCGCPDDTGSDEQAVQGSQAGAGSAEQDAAVTAAADGAVATETTDAATEAQAGSGAVDKPKSDASVEQQTDAQAAALDAGPACPEGQVLCDDECINDIAPTAAALHERVLSKSCALSKSCHTGFSPKEGMNLTTLDDVFATAVDKPSKQDPARKLIDPGHPESSYLIAKLRNMNIAALSSTGKEATRMPPPPLSPLCESKIARLEAWIKAGALRD